MAQGKIYPSAASAVADVPDGAVVMLGGFGTPGLPQGLIKGLLSQGARGLTCISNTCFEPRADEYNVARLVENGQVSKLITTFIGRPAQEVPALDLWRAGVLQVEVMPQGILAERMRAAAAGLGGVFVPNVYGHPLDAGLEKRTLNGVEHVLAPPLRADFALIGAHRGDHLGNLTYRLTQRNYNPAMAAAAAVTVAEVREVVAAGGIDPERVVTPGVYVDRLVLEEPS